MIIVFLAFWRPKGGRASRAPRRQLQPGIEPPPPPAVWSSESLCFFRFSFHTDVPRGARAPRIHRQPGIETSVCPCAFLTLWRPKGGGRHERWASESMVVLLFCPWILACQRGGGGGLSAKETGRPRIEILPPAAWASESLCFLQFSFHPNGGSFTKIIGSFCKTGSAGQKT